MRASYHILPLTSLLVGQVGSYLNVLQLRNLSHHMDNWSRYLIAVFITKLRRPLFFNFAICSFFFRRRKSSSFDILELRRMNFSSHHTTIDLTDKENINSTTGHSDSMDSKRKVVFLSGLKIIIFYIFLIWIFWKSSLYSTAFNKV